MFCLDRETKSRTFSSKVLHLDYSDYSLVCRLVMSSSVFDGRSSACDTRSMRSLNSFLMLSVGVIIPSSLEANSLDSLLALVVLTIYLLTGLIFQALVSPCPV